MRWNGPVGWREWSLESSLDMPVCCYVWLDLPQHLARLQREGTHSSIYASVLA